MSVRVDEPEQRLYLEDFKIGQKFSGSERYVVTPEKIIDFAKTFDPQSFHTDSTAAESSFFKGLVASGWMTASVTMRLLLGILPLAKGVIGSGGEISWPSPTRPGQTLEVTAEILDIASSKSRVGRGMLTVRISTADQTGTLVQVLIAKLLAFGRPTQQQSET